MSLAITPVADCYMLDDEHAHLQLHAVGVGKWEAVDVWVDESHRQTGLARALLLAAHDLVVDMGGSELTAHTAVSNAPARALFASLGYVGQATLGDELHLVRGLVGNQTKGA